MDPNEYQRLAMRTESPPLDALRRILDRPNVPATCGPDAERNLRLLHAALGLCDEAGELAKVLKAHLFYGKPLDIEDIKEEAGDLLWFSALALDAVGGDVGAAMEQNIAKLRARYPQEFTEERAQDRDHEAERKASKQAAFARQHGAPTAFIACPFCIDGRVHGKSQHDWETCPKCDGRGAIPQEERAQRRRKVCLCGSTRFKAQFEEASRRKTLDGYIVLSVGWFSHADSAKWQPTPEQKADLDSLHLDKIDEAHEVFVVNPKVPTCHKCRKPCKDAAPSGCFGTASDCCRADVVMAPYVGASTRREILHALATGKPVRWLERMPDGWLEALEQEWESERQKGAR